MSEVARKEAEAGLPPLRRIVGRQTWRSKYHPKSAGDSVKILLDCGHQVFYQHSNAPKRRARCHRCGRSDLFPVPG